MNSPIEVIQVVSSDGHTFYLDKKCAIVSRVIENMLNTPGTPRKSSLFGLTILVSCLYCRSFDAHWHLLRDSNRHGAICC